jgi:hypothetical protein
MIDNFINGNLSDAKRQARAFTAYQIARALRDVYGYSVRKAIATSHYLKYPSQVTFQAACDAK